MKLRVCVSRYFDIDVDNEIFKTIYEIHTDGKFSSASDEQYKEAANTIEKLTGIPFEGKYLEANTEYIWGIYSAEDDVPILEA